MKKKKRYKDKKIQKSRTRTHTVTRAYTRIHVDAYINITRRLHIHNANMLHAIYTYIYKKYIYILYTEKKVHMDKITLILTRTSNADSRETNLTTS